MFVQEALLKVPARKITTDLVSRTSSEELGKLAVCPYRGAEHLARDFIKGRNYDIAKLIEDGTADFKADKSRALKGSTSHTVKANAGEEYAVFLEDIHPSYVEAYLGFVLYGVRQNEMNSLKQLDRENKSTRAWVDNDNEICTEADMLKTNDDWFLEEEIVYLEKLPYLLKRLHSFSKRYQIHIISAMVASHNAKTTSFGTQKPGLLLDAGVYHMNSKGFPTTKIHKNEGNYRDFFDWFVGKDPECPYYKDMQEVNNICTSLGINLKYENPLIYNEDFFSNLVITYIPSNTEYMQTELNREVIRALSRAKVSDFNMERIQAEAERKAIPLRERVERKLLLFQQKALPAYQNHERLELIIDMYGQLVEERIDTDNLVSYENILKFPNMEFFYMNVSPFYTNNVLNAVAVLHTSGYLILLDETSALTVLDINLAYSYLYDLLFGGIKPGQAYNQFKFGTWAIY